MELLMLDDEIVFLNSMKRRVDWQLYGIDVVHTARNGRDARRILAEHPIELTLCDIEMYQESGLAFYESVAQDHPDLVCIFVTCHPEFDYARKALRLGCMDYILKPIDFVELDGILRKVTGQICQRNEQKRRAAMVEGLLDQVPKEAGNAEVARVQQYQAEHIDQPVVVEQLAEVVHLSPTYLMRIFKRDCSTSIITYATRLKLDLAKRLLRQTSLSVRQICDQLGYINPSYFNRLFKSDTGLTPNEYRNQGKE